MGPRITTLSGGRWPMTSLPDQARYCIWICHVCAQSIINNATSVNVHTVSNTMSGKHARPQVLKDAGDGSPNDCVENGRRSVPFHGVQENPQTATLQVWWAPDIGSPPNGGPSYNPIVNRSTLIRFLQNQGHGNFAHALVIFA